MPQRTELRTHVVDSGNKPATVFVIVMTHKDNRFHPELMDELHHHFDTIEQTPNAAALVITGTGKFFSNGLDLQFLGGADPIAYLGAYQKLLARLLTLNVLTIAAINGHGFAGGCMFAFACDFRVMREDRGYLCLPEVDLGFDLMEGMMAIIKERVSSANDVRNMVLLGKKIDAKEGKDIGIVDIIVPESQVLSSAIDLAKQIAVKSSKREAFGILKNSTYRHVVEALNKTPQFQSKL